MSTLRRIGLLPAALGIVVTALTGTAVAQQSAETLMLDEPADRDVYGAGRDITVRAPIDGDFVAAGQRVTVDGAVKGDVIAAAQTIEILATVDDDVRAAGQHVRVSSPVSGHLVAAGQTVTVKESVGDWAWLAGDTVEVFGRVGDDLKVRARAITINAQIDGDVTLMGEEMRLGPNAVILGNLTWYSNNEANISSAARIEGEYAKAPSPSYMDESGRRGGLVFTLGLIVAVTALFLVFSRPLRSSVERLAGHPGKTLVVGLLVLLVTPLLAVLSFVTVIGIWLGFVVLGVYLAILLIGILTGLFAVGESILRRFRPNPTKLQTLAAAVGAVVAVGLLTDVPILGFVTVVVVWIFGIGALCWGLWAALQNSGSVDSPDVA